MKPDELFDRLVIAGKGFGSYCFGQNNLFLGVLRGLKYRYAPIDVLSSSKITHLRIRLFRAYACGARVNTAPPEDRGMPILSPLTHLIIIVQFDTPASDTACDATDISISNDLPTDQLYLADVGFGGVFGVSGLVRPIPLIDGYIVPGSAAPEEHRIIAARSPNTVILSEEGDQWMLQARRNSSEKESG